MKKQALAKRKKTPFIEFTEASALPSFEGESPLLYSSYEFVGVELEIENIKNINIEYLHMYNITVKNDHSLKLHGRELVFSKALCGKNIVRALSAVEKELQKNKPHFEGNRGSTHIHINMTDLTLEQVINFILLSYFMEPFLMQTSNVDRRNSPFAVTINRTRDAKAIIQRISEGSVAFSADKFKYRAIGLNSMYFLGSLEFRMFHSTSNKDQVLSWINTLLRIKEASKNIEDVESVLVGTLSGGLEDTMIKIFGGNIFPLEESTKASMWDFIRDLQVSEEDCVEPDCNCLSSFYKRVHKLGV